MPIRNADETPTLQKKRLRGLSLVRHLSLALRLNRRRTSEGEGEGEGDEEQGGELRSLSRSPPADPNKRSYAFSYRDPHSSINLSVDVIHEEMSSARDPFYIIKEEIQDSIEKLQQSFDKWEASDSEERSQLSKGILVSCKSILWQVDELERAIAIASKDPAYYQTSEAELEKRRKWTSAARSQADDVRCNIEASKGPGFSSSNLNGVHKELRNIQSDPLPTEGEYAQYRGYKNNEFIYSESDRQQLLIRRQDEELDELSSSVKTIGGLGLSIREELMGQEKILEDLSSEIETTLNRLDFVQKKVAFVMSKASAKGQLMMIAFLFALFLVLFFLVFVA